MLWPNGQNVKAPGGWNFTYPFSMKLQASIGRHEGDGEDAWFSCNFA